MFVLLALAPQTSQTPFDLLTSDLFFVASSIHYIRTYSMVWLGDLWAMLSPVFGTLLVLAQIYELWFLISNVLPSKQRDRRSAFTKFACYPFHQLQTEFSIKSKSTRKVFRDFVRFFASKSHYCRSF